MSDETPTERIIRPLPLDPIVIVDDERVIAETMATLIAGLGFSTVCQPHGYAALLWLQEHVAALVITDLDMPYMDGWQLCRAIRELAEQRATPPPPIILMTAQLRFQHQPTGGMSLLTKPFDLADLEAAVFRYLPRRAPQPARAVRPARRFSEPDQAAM